MTFAPAVMIYTVRYLQGGIRYSKERVVDDQDEAVMMSWEGPLMQAHAQVLCGENTDRHVLVCSGLNHVSDPT